MDRLKVLYPPQPPPAAAEAEDEECARRLHRELNPRPARRGRVRPREKEEGARGGAVKEEAEEVKVRAVEWVGDVKAEPVEVKIRALEWVGDEDAGPGAAGGGKRRRVNGAEAGTSGQGAGERRRPGNGRIWGASRFRGVTKASGCKGLKPWQAQSSVLVDGKQRHVGIGSFAREEDAARAYDRVRIAKLGHAEAKTNFPVAEYRAEWAELEAMGMDGAVALMKERAVADRRDVQNKLSRFKGVYNNGSKARPFQAQIRFVEGGKYKCIGIAYFIRKEDAARAYDRVSIAAKGHAKASSTTNFPVAEYREEWAQLEALGVDGAVALVREHVNAEREDTSTQLSRFRGVTKDKVAKNKPWHAQIMVTEDNKQRRIHIGCFAREEDAARAFDRVKIATKGHSEAKTNFPVEEYREEWAQLEALGVDGAVALMKEHAAAERPDLVNKSSQFRGVHKMKGAKAKPWIVNIYVTEDGKQRQIHFGSFAREEDAARARDRVSIAKLGHAQAKTNFPVAEYRAEWAELEALGVHGAIAMERERVAEGRPAKASRFRGVSKDRGAKAKPWQSRIQVTENGKQKHIGIARFAREEDAARAWDRVSIAKLGHAKAKTNFPVAEYKEEWAELEALGAEAAAACEKQRAKRLEA